MHIDWWTLALQTINVLVLLWILSRFFFRPVMDIVARRQEEAGRMLSDAAAERQQAAAARAEADKVRAGIEAGRQAQIEEARKEALAEKARVLEDSKGEVAKLRADAMAAATRDRAAAEDALLERAGEVSVDIARRLLARLPPGPAFQVFLDGLCRQVRELSAEAKEGFAPVAGSDQPVEVRTARPLSADEEAGVRKGLREALGFDPALAFRHDPALLAGLEVHGRTTILRNTWQADLDRIREELSHDGHDGAS